MASGKLEGAIVVPSSGWSASLTETGGGGASGSISIAAGTYYWSSTTNFLTTLKAALEDVGNYTYTCSIDAAEGEDGKVTVSATNTFTLEAGTDDLFLLMGFHSDLTPAASSFESDDQARNLWLAEGAQQRPRPAGDSGLYETNNRAMISPTGKMWTLGGVARRVLPISWEGVSDARTLLENESVDNESFERFWKDNVLGDYDGDDDGWAAVGNAIRLYWDADDDATYATYKVRGRGLEELPVDQLFDHYLGQWRIELELVEVPS